MVMLPPQSDSSRALARHIADAVPDATVIVAETAEDAKREIAAADAAYGTLPADILRHAQRLRWLQSPQAAPPAGYYHPELIAHPVTVTNLRGIFADRVPAHIMAYVLAFARGRWWLLWPNGMLCDHTGARAVQIVPPPQAAAFDPSGTRLACILDGRLALIDVETLACRVIG